MFRTDIFAGIPAGAVSANATKQERLDAMVYAVSECEVYPTTRLDLWEPLGIEDEGARLWMAGYKMLPYVTIPNDEVPDEFLKTGAFTGTMDTGASE